MQRTPFNKAPIVDFHGKDVSIFSLLFLAETYVFPYNFRTNSLIQTSSYTFMDVKNKQNKTLCCKQYET